MKIQFSNFRGRAPRVSPRLLPAGMAQVATNSRLLSGDLETWKDNALQFALAKKGSPYIDAINTIFPMAIASGDLKWLHWTDSELGTGAVEVDVSKGPILGDISERIYITGLGRPRWTYITPATDIDQEPPLDPVPTEGAYPYRTFPLGLPGPDEAPEVRVEGTDPDADPGADAIPVVNPGAELAIGAEWTSDVGALGRCYSNGIPDPGDGSVEGDIVAYEGTHYFSGGGTEATTEAYQDIDLTTVGLTSGQDVSLKYRSASGAVGGSARVVLSFFNGTDPNGEASASYPAPSATWVLGEAAAKIPTGTTKLRLTIIIDNAGTPGVDKNDGYIDDIKLRADTFSYSDDGSDLTAWETSPQETTGRIKRVFVADSGIPKYGSVYRMEGNNTVAWMRKDFGLNNAGSFQLDLDVRRSQRSQPYIVVGSSKTGAGEGICYRDYGFGDNGDKSRIEKFSLTGVDDEGIYKEALGEYFQIGTVPAPFASYFLRFSLAGTYKADGTWSVALKVTDPNNLTLSETTVTLAEFGGWIQLKSKGLDGGSNSYSDFDNITMSVTPRTSTGGPGEETSGVNYVYTFVNEVNGEKQESAQSDVSLTVVRLDGRGVIITTDTESPADFVATSKRIYRSASGAEGTVYLLVAEIPLDQAEYTDTKTDAQLGVQLSSQSFDTPPANGRGILATANGITWMFADNQLCASEQNRPYAWPQAYRLATDYPIVAIGAMDTDIVVATQANPYIAVGSTPDQITMAKLEKPQGCVSKRSMVTIAGIGVVYASPDGLTAVSRGSVAVITESLISRKEWQALNPSTIHAVEHDGRYIGFYGGTAGFIFDPTPNGFGWIDLDFYASAAYSNPLTDQLFLVIGGDLYIWDAAETKRAQTWKSPQLKLPHPASFSIADVRIVAGSGTTTLKLYADGSGTPFFTKAITASGEFVLPSTTCQDYIEAQLEGTGTFQVVTLAESAEELP